MHKIEKHAVRRQQFLKVCDGRDMRLGRVTVLGMEFLQTIVLLQQRRRQAVALGFKVCAGGDFGDQWNSSVEPCDAELEIGQLRALRGG